MNVIHGAIGESSAHLNSHDQDVRNRRIRNRLIKESNKEAAIRENDQSREDIVESLSQDMGMLSELELKSFKSAKEVVNLNRFAGLPMHESYSIIANMFKLEEWEEWIQDNNNLDEQEFDSKIEDLSDSILALDDDGSSNLPTKILSILDGFLSNNKFSNSPAFVYATLVSLGKKIADDEEDEERAQGMCNAIDELLATIEEKDGSEILASFKLSKNKQVKQMTSSNPKVLESIIKLEQGSYEIKHFMNECFPLLKEVNFERLVPTIMQFRMHVISEVSGFKSFESKNKLSTFVALEQTLILVNTLYQLLKKCAIPVEGQQDYAQANALIIKDILRTVNMVGVLKKPNMNFVNDFLLLWYERDKENANYQTLNHKIGVFVKRLPFTIISPEGKESIMQLFLKLLGGKFGYDSSLVNRYLPREKSIITP